MKVKKKVGIKFKIYIFGSISNPSLSFSIEKLQNAFSISPFPSAFA